MFSRRPNKENNTNLRVVDGGKSKTQRGISMLAEGCTFNGKIFLRGEARLGGRVEGSVISDGALTVEESALIVGDLQGECILINGKVEGNLRVSELLKLSATARITGDLAAKRLVVEDGARINGKVTFLEIAPSASNQPGATQPGAPQQKSAS